MHLLKYIKCGIFKQVRSHRTSSAVSPHQMCGRNALKVAVTLINKGKLLIFFSFIIENRYTYLININININKKNLLILPRLIDYKQIRLIILKMIFLKSLSLYLYINIHKVIRIVNRQINKTRRFK